VQWGLEFQQRQETDASAFSNFDLEQLADGSFPINYYGNFLNQFAVGSGESQNMWGLYGQWIHAFANDLRLTLGARYDDYELFDSRISPRVGLVKELTTSAQLKILYGEAYRAPSLSETGLMNNPVLIGNPDVESELVKTWELVLQNQWQSAHTTFTLFHNAYEQPISAGFQQNVRTYVNGENQSAQGVTFNLFSSLADNWVLKANATYFMDLPDPAFRESEKLANLMLIWTQSKWNMGLVYHYQGARETLISTTEKIQLPSGQSVNINVGYEIQKNLLLELKIKNLFDEYQVSPPQGLGIAKGVPFRGIESVLAVEWSW
jgi:iron complex outermembrane receptor protein